MHGYINIKDLKLTVQCESFRAESTIKSFITSNSRTTNLEKTDVVFHLHYDGWIHEHQAD